MGRRSGYELARSLDLARAALTLFFPLLKRAKVSPYFLGFNHKGISPEKPLTRRYVKQIYTEENSQERLTPMLSINL